MKGQSAVRNLVNGNLRDAKKSSKGCSWQMLRDAAVAEGLPDPEAAANYLKENIGFQEYANREFAAKEKNKNAL